MTHELQDKTILLTGASRGIGAAAVEEFVAVGARVGMISRSAGALEELSERFGDRVMALPCDVSDFASLDGACQTLEGAFGPVDVLVNNAAVLDPIATMGDADPAAWAKLIDINVNGVFYGMRSVLPGMVERGGGTILTVSSGAAHNAYEGWSAYCASKAAAAMMTESLMVEYASAGIRAMGLSTGTVATQMQRDIKASGVGPVAELDWEDHVPAAWPAKALVWMATSEADAHIGQELKLRDEGLRRAIGVA